MTSSPLPGPRGLTALIPTSAPSTAGERAAAQLLHLRTVALPVPVIAAAAELLAERLEDPDPVTRQAAADVHAHLTAALRDFAS
ncbi:hypothetical protein [Kitasatospora sp. LaBMicrA B282]|uniref:hypothetical protein n=1 Tax=Kitasatospora sp. LaBMicrA B282 TaxID=3420949 RepID=UPI003D150943